MEGVEPDVTVDVGERVDGGHLGGGLKSLLHHVTAVAAASAWLRSNCLPT